MFVGCVMPQTLVGMTTREKNKVLSDVSAFLKTDSAQWTDQAIATVSEQINKLSKVEPNTAQGFRAQLEGGKRLRDAIRIGQTQQQASQVELAAEKTRREQAEKSLVALRTQLEVTSKDLQAVQTVQKKYDDEKQKNNPQISKNELERRRLLKELADQKKSECTSNTTKSKANSRS